MKTEMPAQRWLLSKPAVIAISTIVLLSSVFFITKAGGRKRQRINPAFSAYISAYTAGSISRESTIRVQLAGNFADSSKIGQEAEVFSFSPAISGTAKWINASTLEFKPNEALPSGQDYEATFRLDRIVDVPEDLEEFEFTFSVVQQSFEVTYPGIEAMNPSNMVYQRMTGTLLTADVEEDALVEQLLQAEQDGKKYAVKWDHAADKRTHRYRIDSLVRKSTMSEVHIRWDGSPIHVDLKGEHLFQMPALGDFTALAAKVVNDGSQYIAVSFSDPLLSNQDLNGLIHFGEGVHDAAGQPVSMRFTVDGQVIKCYPGTDLNGVFQLIIETGITNTLGYKLKNRQVFEIDFADLEPRVTILGKGVILPASNKLVLPFEAVNLNAVDVRVVRIYENNVAQFLQVNDLQGNNELVRVGRQLVKKTIRLDRDKLTDLRKANQFSLNLEELIRTEPGAIYEVRLSFKKEYSLYRCNGNDQAEPASELQAISDDENWDGDPKADASMWDYADDYYNENYNWNDRNDPCKPSFYNPERWARRNILASDLGIMAKRGANNDMLIVVTHLITTKPMSGVSLDLLDYQQQRITTAVTDANGMAHVNASRKPFLIVAKFKDQRGYLKADDGSAIATSQFDVSGEVVQRGIKGMLYGERGVWRPGDSIYLTFILEDKLHNLPPSHPVTFELMNPLGALVKRQVQARGLNGFYDFRTATDEDAITGNYQAIVKVGSLTFQRVVKIETVMPNRLKIELNFPKATISKEDEVKPVLRSRWLHGAIADGLDAKVEATLSASTTQFKKYPEFVFDNPTRRFQGETKTVFEGKLNQDGEVSFPIDLQPENAAGGMLNANFVTKVFEPGGNFSIDRFSIPYHPYNTYVGFRMPKGDVARGMLLTDTNHKVQVVCLNSDGTLKKGKRELNVKLYKVQWRWWWDKSYEDLSNFSNNEEYSSILTKTVTINNGIGIFDFRVNYPEWGRYLMVVEDQDGHSAGKAFYMDWPGWAGRPQRDNALEASMLTFNLNKKSFRVGEQCVVTVPTPQAGRMLVSLENGSRVIDAFWAEATKGFTQCRFTVTKDMLPNIFVHVTLVQPHAQTINDLPIRMYGIMPVDVEDPQSVLQPVIAMASQIRPDMDQPVTITEANGRAMTYTLAVVDEGLLDLTRFKTPDPHSNFYAHEALGVKTWDMFDYVMGAFGTAFNRVLSIGGDAEVNRKSDAGKAKRFKPAIRFIGPFFLLAGQSHKHNLRINDYIGSVRVMVVAGQDGAYGNAEKAVPVKKPLMVLATLPRVLRPGEEVKLPVNVFALESNIKNVRIQVTGNELVEVRGGASKSMQFAKPGDEMVAFDLRVNKNTGIARVKVIATSGNERAEVNVELNVENPNPMETNVYQGNPAAAANWEASYTLPGIAGTNTLTLEVSTIPPLNLENRLRYLIHYPYGCVEQTTSSVFPQLALNKLMDLAPGWQVQIEKNVRAGIQRLSSFQTSEGGFAYWPGLSECDDWSSSYVGHFLLEARQSGYALPTGMLSNWMRYQKNKSMTWTGTGDHAFSQAYRLYTLALAGSPEMGAMNRLRELSNLSSPTRWRLAAAYVLAGNKEVARDLIAKDKPKKMPIPETEMENSYGSPERDAAMMLETTVLLGDNKGANNLLKFVCEQLGSNTYMSTQTTAYALFAVASVTGKLVADQNIEFDYVVNGKSTSFAGKGKITQLQLPAAIAKGKVVIRNKSKQMLFARLIARGKPELGKQTASRNNLDMQVSYKNMEGLSLNPASLEQGTDFKVEVKITNPGMLGNLKNLALSQMFPSGWEILNTRMDGNTTDSRYGVPSYQDIRDDRVYSFFDLEAKKEVTFVLLLHAGYQGRFYLPGPSCEAMYNGNATAREAGMWVEVTAKKKSALTAR